VEKVFVRTFFLKKSVSMHFHTQKIVTAHFCGSRCTFNRGKNATAQFLKHRNFDSAPSGKLKTGLCTFQENEP